MKVKMGWKFKYKEGGKYIWACDFYTDLQGFNINNFVQYGQPFDPYEPGFNHELSDTSTDIESIEIEMPQHQVMHHGYGRKVKLDYFAVVNQFLSNKNKLPPGKYSFSDLIKNKFTYPYSAKFTTNLYYKNLISGIDSGEIPRSEAAYTHGSVGFELIDSSLVFEVNRNFLSVDGEIIATDDNFDYHSPNPIIEAVEPLVETLLGRPTITT